MILVTGGTGLLGSHLLLDLVVRGGKIRAIRRENSDVVLVGKVFSYYVPNAAELMSKIEWFDADLLDFGRMEEAMSGITEVYHCGAVVSFYPNDHRQMLKVNIDGTANLVNLAIEHHVRKFCYVSSIATMGSTGNDDHSTEESYWVRTSKTSVYGISKVGAEREIWRGIEEGLNAVIINPSVILGPGFWHDNSGLFRLVGEGLKYYTDGVNSYVDARDVSKAMIILMEREIFGDRFICSAGELSYLDFFSGIARYLGKPAPTVKVPPIMTELAWRIEAVRSFLTGSKPEITREMAVHTNGRYRYSSEKLRKTIDFKFRQLDESIREICGFYLRDHGQEIIPAKTIPAH